MEEFCIIAVEILSEDSVGKRKLASKRPYYFRKGYYIDGLSLRVDSSKTTPSGLYDVYALDSEKQPHIALSAIVGENGAGKSTLVEFLIRLLNNLGAYAFGEGVIFPGAEHIHRIEHLKGAIYYIMDGTPYYLELDDGKLSLFVYALCNSANDFLHYKKSSHKIRWQRSGTYNPSRKMQVLHLQKLFDKLFYTVVSNYSIYAYNTEDYRTENNSVAYEQKCRYPKLSKEDREKISIKEEECSWLRGVFHKNDGYQLPIVLTPYRDRGCIDINDENELANERLTSMVLLTDFKTINEHLEVIAYKFEAPQEDNDNWESKCYKKVVSEFNLQDLRYKDFEVLSHAIVKQWGSVIRIYHLLDKRSKYAELAKEYLVFKTIKVIHKYSSHRVRYEELCKKVEYRNTKMKNSKSSNYFTPWARTTVNRLSKDKSHVTKKLRQTLAYFVFQLYDTDKWEIESLVTRLAEVFHPYSTANPNNPHNFQIFDSIEDLLPPPFVHTTLMLREKGTQADVAFETLSSGEKQMAYATSSIAYHLHNIHSLSNGEVGDRIRYRYVNVILEEIELYFHPEMQKKFVRYLLDAIRQTRLSNLRGINILLVTHSPFVLSDIPSSSIMTLRKDGCELESDKLRTFGSNIHTLLKNSFFMENGTLGDYAQWLCDYILVALNLWEYFDDNPEASCIDLLNDNLTEIFGHRLINEDVYGHFANYVHDDCVWICVNEFKEKHSAEWIWRCIKTYENNLIQDALFRRYGQVFQIQERVNEVEELKHRLEKLTGGRVYVETD